MTASCSFLALYRRWGKINIAFAPANSEQCSSAKNGLSIYTELTFKIRNRPDRCPLCSEYEFYLRKGEFVSPNGKKTPQTILVVEEHPLLLKLVKEILEDAHFTVLHANSAKKAIQIEAEFPGSIDLLLSDVMMQGMSGPDLAKKLKEQRPKMRIILMSAYPDGELLVLNYGWYFIHKSFMPKALVGRVKDVLRSKTREQSTDHFDTRK
jgi:CheY-like chemotaxis protein